MALTSRQALVLKVLKGQVKLTQGEKNVLKHFEIGSTSDASMQATRKYNEACLDETDAEKWVRMAEESKYVLYLTWINIIMICGVPKLSTIS